jgi:hypothetical protein
VACFVACFAGDLAESTCHHGHGSGHGRAVVVVLDLARVVVAPAEVCAIAGAAMGITDLTVVPIVVAWERRSGASRCRRRSAKAVERHGGLKAKSGHQGSIGHLCA